ncbi:MAG: hypothetical protein CMP24_06255 [Rickettsiales bacterium]|nr:hypothetical protein [Rickettsiales bacterium]|tara:strand:- start:363 stop:761 length:399 start_codon:yes stop_codon:yes gene_type:complete
MFNLHKDIDSIEFWEGAKRGKLMIQQCSHSSEYFLYSRANLKYKDGFNYKWVEASGKGIIYSFTITNIAGGSEYFVEKTPYVVAIILLNEGVKIMSNIISQDYKTIKIGEKVEVIFIEMNKDIVFPCFKIAN